MTITENKNLSSTTHNTKLYEGKSYLPITFFVLFGSPLVFTSSLFLYVENVLPEAFLCWLLSATYFPNEIKVKEWCWFQWLLWPVSITRYKIGLWNINVKRSVNIFMFITYQHTRNTDVRLSRLYMQPPNNNFHVLLTFYRCYHTTAITWTF